MQEETCLWLADSAAAAHFDPRRLSVDDQSRWAGFRRGSRREGWEASRALLAHVAPDRDHPTSLSHSGTAAALAIAPPGMRVGIDIETIRQREVVRLAELAYVQEETAQLRSMSPAAAAIHFIILWTLKEAFGKALGLPLPDALQQCVFVNAGRQLVARVPTRSMWWAVVFTPRHDLILAAAAVGERPQDGPAWSCREWPEAMGPPWRQLHVLSRGPASAGVAACSLASLPRA